VRIHRIFCFTAECNPYQGTISYYEWVKEIYYDLYKDSRKGKQIVSDPPHLRYYLFKLLPPRRRHRSLYNTSCIKNSVFPVCNMIMDSPIQLQGISLHLCNMF